MKKNYPGITVFGEADRLGGATSPRRSCRPASTPDPDIKGIYMQSSFAPVRHPAGAQAEGPAGAAERPEARLRRLQRRHPGGARRTSREGKIDATVSQPADLYAKYALYYAKAAIEGKTFQPGPTDHDSTIIQVRDGLLEDQLSAPLVTRTAPPTAASPALKFDDKSLWGNNTSSCTAAAAPSDGPAADGRPVVEAVDITKRFGPTVALDGAGITVRPGETHALVGRNGAGKSTLVRSSPGCRPRTTGAVPFAGEPAPRARPTATPGGGGSPASTRSPRSSPTLTVAENLFLNRHDRGRGRADQLAAAAAPRPASCWRPGRWTSTSRPAGRRPQRRAAAVRGDRPGAVVRRAVHHPRRADRPARRRRRSTGCSTASATCRSRA